MKGLVTRDLSTPTHIPSVGIEAALTEEWSGGEINALAESYELVSVDSIYCSAHSTHLYNHCIAISLTALC